MTITFNKVGIILRGHCANPAYVMSNTAKNVELTTKEQEAEVKSLEQAGIIAVIYQEEAKPKINEFKITSPKVVENKSKYKKIKKISDREMEKDIENSPATVVTENGPVTAKMFNGLKSPEDVENPASVKESLEAMKKLEDEEKVEDTPLNDKDLRTEDKTGNEAIISMGNNVFKKVSMKRSMVEGQDTVDKNNPFIDPNPSPAGIIGKNGKKQKTEFVPKDDDEKSDAFVEI